MMINRVTSQLAYVVLVIVVALVFLGSATIQVEPVSAASVETADALVSRTSHAVLRKSNTDSLEFVNLKTTVTVWADNKGEITIQQRIRNTGTEPILDFTWGFGFGDTRYDPIRAWDEIGPLRYTVTQTDYGIEVKSDFRQPLLQNQEYQFAMLIGVDGMTETNGDDGRAQWVVQLGTFTRSFIHGITLPLSASIQGISPEATRRVQSYIEWQGNDTDEDLTIDVTYRLRNDIPNVPLFYQGALQPDRDSAPWWNDTWYTYSPNTPGENIAKWGCNLTSAAMLINYYAAATGSSARTTPGQLNQWIRSKGIKSVSAIYSAAMSYAKELGVRLYRPEQPALNSGVKASEVLQTYLRTGNPVILRVDAASASGIHFVVATGITSTAGGQTTYTINDPVYGTTTLSNRYPGGFTQVNFFNSTSPDQRTLMSIIHSPAELVMTDPEGRRIGYDPVTGEEFNEIPGAIYERSNIAPATEGGEQEPPDEKFVFIPSPLDGAYSVRVIGIDDGSYLVENVASDWSGDLSVASFTGVTTDGQVDEQILHYDGILGVTESMIYLPTVQR